MVTAYLLAQTAVTPVYGKLGDLYGRKVVLQVALVVFLIGSALCGGWSPDENPDLERMVSRLAAELLCEPSAEVGAPA